VEVDACVVTGGDGFGAGLRGHVEELVKLDEVVAERARDGSAAGDVVLDEGLDDLLFEALLEVDDVERDAERLGHPARIVDVVERAAAAGRAAFGDQLGHALLVPELHRHADDGLVFGMQQGRDDG